MIKNFRIFSFLLIVLFVTSVAAQTTPAEFKRLIGQKTVYVQSQLKIKGYEPIIQGRRNTNRMYNKKTNRCLTLGVSGDKVTSIVDSEGANCVERGHGIHHPDPKPGQPAHIENADLVGKTATEAYAKLKKRRFSETKEVRDGANTYKLWMNSNGECLKTTSRDGKITSVKASANCR